MNTTTLARRVAAGCVAFLVILAVLAAAAPAHAAAADRPATREYITQVIVERALHVPAEDLPDGDCYADRDAFTRTRYGTHRAVYACYVRQLGYMHGTRRNAAGFPVFDPQSRVTRAQMASVIMRMATQERVELPNHAAVFIDVRRGSTHERAIRFGAVHGLIKGYPGTPATFRPDASVTRRQVRVLVGRVVAARR